MGYTYYKISIEFRKYRISRFNGQARIFKYHYQSGCGASQSTGAEACDT